jgi:hypothetical protein
MLKLAIYLLLGQVAILLAARPVIQWYLGINQVLMLLRSIDRSLKCLPAVQHEHYAQSLRVNRR